jgi:hypothetical protein
MIAMHIQYVETPFPVQPVLAHRAKSEPNALLEVPIFFQSLAISGDEPHVLSLNHPLPALTRLAITLRTNFFLVRHKHKAIAETPHWTILPLVQPYIARNLHTQAHVPLQLFFALALNRSQSAVQDVDIQRLRLEVRPGHFLLEARREDGRIVEHVAVVADVRQSTTTGLSDRRHVEGRQLVARAV